MDKMSVKEKDLVGRLLKQSILTVCRETVSYSRKLEVDGIVCISLENDTDQIVIKVHEFFQKPNGVDIDLGDTISDDANGIEFVRKQPITDINLKNEYIDLESKKYKKEKYGSGQFNNCLIEKSPKSSTKYLKANSWPDSSKRNLHVNQIDGEPEESLDDNDDLSSLDEPFGQGECPISEQERVDNSVDINQSDDDMVTTSAVIKKPIMKRIMGQSMVSSARKSSGKQYPTNHQVSLPESGSVIEKSPPEPGYVYNGPAPKAEAKSIKNVECKRCDMILPDGPSFENHNLDAHNVYTCFVCYNTFTCRNNMKRHMRLHTGYRPYQCTLCSESFTRKDDIKRHLIRHNYSKPFRCSLCGKGYMDRKTIKNHMRKEHLKKLLHCCPTCGESFDDTLKFQEHKKSHPELMVYQCGICKFTGSNPLMYNKHMLIHGQEKAFQCKPCGTTFNDPFRYSSHLKRHRLESEFTSYQCCFCTHMLPTYDQFVKHEHTHVQCKRHTCPMCLKQFRYPSNLREHMLIHSDMSKQIKVKLERSMEVIATPVVGSSATSATENDEMSCEAVAPETKNEKENLDGNEMKNSNNNLNQYWCTECQQGFGSEDHLTEHIALAHDENSLDRIPLKAQSEDNICTSTSEEHERNDATTPTNHTISDTKIHTSEIEEDSKYDKNCVRVIYGKTDVDVMETKDEDMDFAVQTGSALYSGGVVQIKHEALSDGEEELMSELSGSPYHTSSSPSSVAISPTFSQSESQDLNECKDSRRNKCPGECINVPGSFHCNCSLPGFLPSSKDVFCRDFDECSQDNGNCHYKCINTHGSYQCRCQKGFQLTDDKHNCTDIDECQKYGSKICKNGYCVNKEGTYQCICNDGYEQHTNGIHCTDVNECLTNNGGCGDVCKNGFGTYYCLCTLPGYQLDENRTHCQDINECDLDNGGCEDVCINTMGSFQCYCNQTGFVLHQNGENCTICQSHEYIDEFNKKCVDCPPNSSTYNFTASSVSECICNPGFQGNPSDNVTCEDIDECSANMLNCTEGCYNTAGSALCTCPLGFVLEDDQRSCTDIDECRYDNGGCSATCQNNIGSFTCTCNSGFELDSDNRTCLDIDECWVDWHNCSHHCTNSEGGATCSCKHGYELQEDGKTCEDKDECELAGEIYCEDKCINTEGSFKCECTDLGYKLSWDYASCSDINECMEGENNCEDVCINILGSFTCRCDKPGFSLSPDGHTCFDNDECQSEELNKCEHTCVNTPGGYLCRCLPGYIKAGYYKCEACPIGYYQDENSPTCIRCPQLSTTNGTAKSSINDCFCRDGYYGDVTAGENCQDIDECQDENFGCEQNCYNTKGSAHCGCRSGYTVHENSKNCTDRDECIYQSHYCADKCINLPGSYKCGCRTGFKIRYDGRYCTDVNECYENNPCEDYCENFWGSYACRCRKQGYILAPDGHTCIATSETLECPKDVFVEVKQDLNSTNVTLPAIVSSNEYTIIPEWVESGAFFPVGVTTVTIAENNGGGNSGSCSFDVHVMSICGNGTFKEADRGMCLPCPVGTYQTEVNQFSCKKCFPGTYQDLTGQSECKNCTPGTYQNMSSQSECSKCQKGTYQEEAGQLDCKECSIGTFQNATGQLDCFMCPFGMFQDVEGREECKICSNGTFQDEVGKDYCKACPPDLTSYPDNGQMQQQCPSLNEP